MFYAPPSVYFFHNKTPSKYLDTKHKAAKH